MKQTILAYLIAQLETEQEPKEERTPRPYRKHRPSIYVMGEFVGYL